ncbi:unnamed protein product [Lactuca saligna]|uniref:PB1-like domain-containing protein n=1 Tax=Lactuca saligna TaxID=75948 RepID=A0AA36E2X1_LACSI|nr:unnamed protein product [Lactuca saligna]
MAIFISIEVHFQGVFIKKPFCYSDGIHHVFENIDFDGMSYTEFTVFLEGFTQEKCEKLYYCQSKLEKPAGIHLNEFMSQQHINMEGVTYKGVSQANGNQDATRGENPKDDEDENIPNVEDDNVRDVKGKPRFNEDIP